MKGVRVGSKNDITMPATKVTVAKKSKKLMHGTAIIMENTMWGIRGRRFNSQP